MMSGELNNVHRHSYFPAVLLLHFAKLNGIVLLFIGLRGGKQQGLDLIREASGPELQLVKHWPLVLVGKTLR